jgi:hypothetical protein
MVETRQIYGEVNSKTGLKKVFTEIRRDVETAQSRPALTELYKRAGYLITLTHAPSWQEKFGAEAAALRRLGEEDFRKTAKKINRRAAEIGTEANYDETWGHWAMSTTQTYKSRYRPTKSKYKGGASEM